MLVRAGDGGARTVVVDARAVTPGEWPGEREALVTLLREAKRTHRLAARARVVLWGLAEPRAAADPIAHPAIAPLIDAGFEIDALLSPAEALADIVRSRAAALDSVSTVAAMAVDTHGAVIAIVAGGEVADARVFSWPLGRPFRGLYSELLERYLLVSQLAPELQQLTARVRPSSHASNPASNQAPISVLVCGHLPNLRSIAMLLVDELDVEVETLDSEDLLDRRAARFVDLVPGLQLATVASAPAPRQRRALRGGLLTAAALVLAATWAVLHHTWSTSTLPTIAVTAAPLPASTLPSTPLPVTPELRAEPTVGRVDAVTTAPPAPSAPLPRLDGVMISSSRRLAVFGSEMVAPGDRLGAWTVVRIERDFVIVRDAPGRVVRLAIRVRKPARPPS